MKLCSILIDGKPCVGAETSGGIIDITSMGYPAQMNEIIAGGSEMLEKINEALIGEEITYNEKTVEFLPVTEPMKIICEGLNYKDHAEETGGEPPPHPIFFSKYSDALIGHNQEVPLPQWFNRYDYEAELVVVIGKPAYNIAVEEAKDYIFGYTCGNDISVREAQFLSTQWLCGKAIPNSGPVGPYIVTSDEFDPYEPHRISCEVNGETVQSADVTQMIFPCYEAVSAASRFFPLSPGDLLFTGTPAGVIQGKKHEERKWLKAGDIVKVTIDGIGTLTTPLVTL